MRDLATALALMLVFEGALLALFSDRMARAAELLKTAPPATLRAAGLGLALAGLILAQLVRG